MTVNLSLALTIFVVVLLIIDLVYRIKFPHVQIQSGPVKDKHETIKEFFRDYKDQLSWTRLALSTLLIFVIVVVMVGLWKPTLWDKCKEIFNTVLEWCKWLYGLNKTPEAVGQVGQIFHSTPPNASTTLTTSTTSSTSTPVKDDKG